MLCRTFPRRGFRKTFPRQGRAKRFHVATPWTGEVVSSLDLQQQIKRSAEKTTGYEEASVKILFVYFSELKNFENTLSGRSGREKLVQANFSTL